MNDDPERNKKTQIFPPYKWGEEVAEWSITVAVVIVLLWLLTGGRK